MRCSKCSKEGYGDGFRVKGARIRGETEKIGVHKPGTEEKKGDLIELYKVSKGLEEVDLGVNIGRGIGGRSHTHQIVREDCPNCNLRGRFLPNRTATTWNLLPPNVVEAVTVNGFKSRLDALIVSGSLRRSVYQF